MDIAEPPSMVMCGVDSDHYEHGPVLTVDTVRTLFALRYAQPSTMYNVPFEILCLIMEWCGLKHIVCWSEDIQRHVPSGERRRGSFIGDVYVAHVQPSVAKLVQPSLDFRLESVDYPRFSIALHVMNNIHQTSARFTLTYNNQSQSWEHTSAIFCPPGFSSILSYAASERGEYPNQFVCFESLKSHVDWFLLQPPSRSLLSKCIQCF